MIRFFPAALAAVALGTAQAPAQEQAYRTMDGKKVATNDRSLWTELPKQGDKGGYFQCLWDARDDNDVKLNEQIVIYFPNAPIGNDTDKSNHWVYWFKPAKPGDGVGMFWGRCPTPKHPAYKQLQVAAQGPDLWQVIPPEKRVKDLTTVADLRPLFGPFFSTENSKLPKIAPKKNATIECVDFGNPVFN